MKNLIIIFGCLFMFTGCTSGEEKLQEEEFSIFGTWKLVEILGSDGNGDPQWQNPIEDSYKYTFKRDGTFTSTRFSEDCTYGVYILTDSTLTLDFGCEDFTTGIESPEGTFVEYFTISEGNIILTPSYLTCTEGCDYKFQKIAGE